MSNPKVIIWGPDNYNALGLLRQLAPANLEVLFLVNGRIEKCATKSKFCKNYVKTSSYEEGLNFLLDNFDISDGKKILIPIGDRAAEVIDLHRLKLNTRFFLMGTQGKLRLRDIDDKNNMVALAAKCGFLVPKSMRFRSSFEVGNFPIPFIIKPTSFDGMREFKTKIINSEKEFGKFRKYLNPNFEYIIQEFIHKTHDILVYGCRMNNGDIKLAGQFMKDRWSDDGGGSHGLLTNELPEYITRDAISKFLNEINYVGLFSVEYGLLNGKAYFYEFNLRNDGTSHLFYQAGANLPLAWVYDCLGIHKKCNTSITITGWNINEIYDIANVFHGRISYSQYKKEKDQATIFHYYDKEDIEPWKYTRKKAIWDLPLRAFLQKFRPQIVALKSKLHL